MQSCFYEGTISHHRLRPAAHRFDYRLFLVYVDLAEIDSLFGACGLWSTRRPAVARFCRTDHLGNPQTSLDEAVRDLVETRLDWRPNGPITLLTNFRYLGFQMNPVSLFYCFESDGDRLLAVVAEVNNTPWNQRHCYVLDLRDGGPQNETQLATVHHGKQFHVSPFFPMEMEYRWQVSAPGSELTVRIESCVDAVKQFDATLSLQRKAITSASRFEMLARYPAMTLRNFTRIYWQAFRLWRKGVPFYPHPESRKNSGPNGFASKTHEAVDRVVKTSA